MRFSTARPYISLGNAQHIRKQGERMFKMPPPKKKTMPSSSDGADWTKLATVAQLAARWGGDSSHFRTICKTEVGVEGEIKKNILKKSEAASLPQQTTSE